MSKYVPIGEVCDIFDGPHATPTKTSSGPIYLGIDAITDDGRLNPSEYNHLSEQDYRVWTKRVTPQKDDIVFSYEATLGRYAMIPEGFYGCLGRRLAIVRAKDDRVNPFWLYYYFLSPEWKTYIANHTVRGSTVNRISVEDFPSFPVPLPARNKQDAVVSMLSAIDEKIINNTHICSELESMAKTIYDYWFTQFDFPDADGKPYRSSGGAMEWNANLGRLLPKDWKVHYLSEIFETKLGGTPDTKEESFWNGDIPWLSSGEVVQSPILTSEKTITSQGMKCSSTSFAEKGTVVLSITRYIRPAILGIDACFNQSVVAIVPNKKYRTEYLYQVILAQVDRYMTLRRGAQQPHINKEIVDKTLVVCPPSEILQKYYDIVEPLYSMHMNAAKENCELTKLRDWLLPLLMTGQATVK